MRRFKMATVTLHENCQIEVSLHSDETTTWFDDHMVGFLIWIIPFYQYLLRKLHTVPKLMMRKSKMVALTLYVDREFNITLHSDEIMSEFIGHFTDVLK